MTYYKNDEPGCLAGCLILLIWALGVALSFAFWGGLIYLAVQMLKDAGAF